MEPMYVYALKFKGGELALYYEETASLFEYLSRSVRSGAILGFAYGLDFNKTLNVIIDAGYRVESPRVLRYVDISCDALNPCQKYEDDDVVEFAYCGERNEMILNFLLNTREVKAYGITFEDCFRLVFDKWLSCEVINNA